MNSKFTRTALAVAGLATVLIAAIVLGNAQSAPAQPTAAPTTPPRFAYEAGERHHRGQDSGTGFSGTSRCSRAFRPSSFSHQCSSLRHRSAWSARSAIPWGPMTMTTKSQANRPQDDPDADGHQQGQLRRAQRCDLQFLHRGAHNPVAVPVIADQEVPKPRLLLKEPPRLPRSQLPIRFWTSTFKP